MFSFVTLYDRFSLILMPDFKLLLETISWELFLDFHTSGFTIVSIHHSSPYISLSCQPLVLYVARCCTGRLTCHSLTPWSIVYNAVVIAVQLHLSAICHCRVLLLYSRAFPLESHLQRLFPSREDLPLSLWHLCSPHLIHSVRTSKRKLRYKHNIIYFFSTSWSTLHLWTFVEVTLVNLTTQSKGGWNKFIILSTLPPLNRTSASNWFQKTNPLAFSCLNVNHTCFNKRTPESSLLVLALARESVSC